MHLQNILHIGLLGLLSPSLGPHEGLVAGRALASTKATSEVEKRGLVSSRAVKWTLKPKVDESKVTNQKVINADYLDGLAEEDDARVFKAAVDGFGDVLFKYFDDELETNLNTEVEAYKKIEGKEIGPQFEAIVTKKGKPFGFLIELLDRASKPTKHDRKACKDKLQAFHDVGLLHGDPNIGQFLMMNEKCYILDFEYSKECHDDDKFKEEMKELDENFDELD
ncbi:Uu.00g078720.m01.CDS01 [Anthostomella pinea]|uniref:Uu.00g078720.m01.CDS01 n=1 Tax=Anthostomella pinea TaxID=933095 RepID=A0AAI8VLM1_9PEZI|nr:Uu.00g078720.m01.CDS01 [Anthostomella pinea]